MIQSLYRNRARSFYVGADSRDAEAVMETVSWAAKLGTTAHLSPLLRKARRLGLDAERVERLAIQRGRDYDHSGDPLPPSQVPRMSSPTRNWRWRFWIRPGFTRRGVEAVAQWICTSADVATHG